MTASRTEPMSISARQALASAAVRGLALFLGAFLLTNLMRGAIDPALDRNLWLLDLRPVPSIATAVWIGVTVLCLLALATGRLAGRALRVARAVFVVNAGVATVNAARVVWLGHAGAVEPFPMPFSLLVALGFAWIAVAASVSGAVDINRAGLFARLRWLAPACVGASAGAAAVVFALAQMLCFGLTDYRRAADAIVVPGARAYASGKPSHALEDRVRTACALYHQGYAPLIVMSGGPGDGSHHETSVMRRVAMELGVPGSAILIDEHGVNSRSTCENSAALLRDRDARRVLVVSHAYHLPRLRMGFAAVGLRAATVPLSDARPLYRLPYFVAREVAAFWAYFVRPPRAG